MFFCAQKTELYKKNTNAYVDFHCMPESELREITKQLFKYKIKKNIKQYSICKSFKIIPNLFPYSCQYGCHISELIFSYS